MRQSFLATLQNCCGPTGTIPGSGARLPFSAVLRSYPWRHHLLCLAPLAILMGILALTLGTGNTLAQYFMDLRPRYPGLTVFMEIVTYGANPCFYALYGYFMIRGLRAGDKSLVRLVLVYLAAQIIISFLLVRLCKMAVGKPRPMSALLGIGYEPFTLEHGNHSFPSGHTTEIVGSVAPLAVFRNSFAFSLLMGLVVALVGFSRIYLSMHHLTDLAGGMVAGTLVGLIIYYFCLRERV